MLISLPARFVRLPILMCVIAMALVLLPVAQPRTVFAAATVYSAAGADAAAIQAKRDEFRGALGGGTVAGANGSFGGLRRELNWDGVPDGFAAPNNMPANFFNVTSPRGVVFSTAGTGFQVSANSVNPTSTPVRFGNLNAGYPSIFTTFSPQRLFTPLGSNIVDLTFFLPGTTTPATISGFGAVFADVDNPSASSIEFFNQNNGSLGKFTPPTANNGLSFLGVAFGEGEQVARIRIITGNAAVGPADADPIDVVVLDDFMYSEPQSGFRFATSAYSASEKGNATVTVLRAGDLVGSASVDYATSDGTATAGVDYTVTTGKLIFASGEISKTFTVPMLDDQLAEDIETINLTLSNSSGAGLGAPSTTVLTIADDELAPSTIFAVTSGNNLIRFSSAAPGAILSTTAVSGLLVGENLLGIDFRPANGQLYGLGSTSRLYTIDLTSGVATQVGASPFAAALSGTDFGFDINPVVDRVRVVSDADQNLRLNPNSGALTATDSTLAYAAGDAHVGADPNLVGVAYSNNVAGATSTTLYGIDSNLDILVIQNPPNNGTLNTVGPLGADSSGAVGFDIARNGTALATLTVDGVAQLYRINVVTGAASMIGSIGEANQIRDIAIAPLKAVYLPMVLK